MGSTASAVCPQQAEPLFVPCRCVLLSCASHDAGVHRDSLNLASCTELSQCLSGGAESVTRTERCLMMMQECMRTCLSEPALPYRWIFRQSAVRRLLLQVPVCEQLERPQFAVCPVHPEPTWCLWLCHNAYLNAKRYTPNPEQHSLPTLI